jgi:hypothetical protein
MNLKQLIIFGIENSSEPVIKNPILRAALEEPGSMVGTPTKEVTQHGRRIFETPEGNVSEKSTTFFLNGQWMNVPSIHEGRAFTDDQLRRMIKEGTIQPTSVHGSRVEAETAAGQRSDMMKSHTRGFDDGGQVIGKPGGLVEPGVMYYGKTYKLREGATTTKIVEHLGDVATAGEVDIDEIRKKFYDDDITDAEIRKVLKKKGYKTSKFPVDDVVEFAIKKSGVTNPEYYKGRKQLQKLYEVIQKYNEVDDISKSVGAHVRDVSEGDLLKEAGYGKKAKAGKMKTARYLIDEYFLTTDDKIKRDLTNLLSSRDTKLSDAVDFTQKMSKKYNKPLNRVQVTLRKIPLWQKNQALVKRLTSHNYTQKFKNHKNFDLMTLGDFIDESNIRANFSLDVANPEGWLQTYAYKHYDQGGDKIKFLTDPHKTPQSDWVFKYKGADGKWTTYDKSSLALSKNDPNFKSFWDTDAQIAKYNNHIVDDPDILKKLGFNKPTSMRNIMARTLGYGTGAEGYYKVSPLDKDHINLKNDPFEVRPMDARINRGAGHLKKELLRGNLTKEQYDQAMKKIGYEYKGKIDFNDPKQFNDLINRDLDFSLKTKLRSKGYLKTPYTIAKEYSERLAKNNEFLNPVAKSMQTDLSPRSIVQLSKEFDCEVKAKGGSIMSCLQGKFKANPEKFLQKSAPLAKNNVNLYKWFKNGRKIARGTGIALAWEAAFAPIIAGWGALEGQSGQRILNDIAYGIPFIGETEKEEWMREAGGDELAYKMKRMGELEEQDLPNLYQQRADVINKMANVEGKSFHQRTIEDDIKEKELELQGLMNTPDFYEGPVGSYLNEPVIQDAFDLEQQTTAKIAADTAERKKATFDALRKAGMIADRNWQSQVPRAEGGIASLNVKK